jgi:ubiquinone/menaquinone biosynthesis C-methylase UbiE
MRVRLRNAPELLDDESHDPRVLEQSLEHVAQVNRFLGGHSAARAAVRPLLRYSATLRILDIGTGSADIPRALVRDARAAGTAVEIIATDIHPQMRAVAAACTVEYPEIRIEAADALALPFPDDTFDVALLSLALHHFEGEAPVTALREAARVAGMVVVNELERSRINYAGAWLLSNTWWRGNVLTRHDGPLSVLRAFTRGELTAIARAAGLADIRIQRRWFYRLLLTARAP